PSSRAPGACCTTARRSAGRFGPSTRSQAMRQCAGREASASSTWTGTRWTFTSTQRTCSRRPSR
ncbi:unnamed protein product, partial [Effrenium voratum]